MLLACNNARIFGFMPADPGKLTVLMTSSFARMAAISGYKVQELYIVHHPERT